MIASGVMLSGCMLNTLNRRHAEVYSQEWLQVTMTENAVPVDGYAFGLQDFDELDLRIVLQLQDDEIRFLAVAVAELGSRNIRNARTVLDSRSDVEWVRVHEAYVDAGWNAREEEINSVDTSALVARSN